MKKIVKITLFLLCSFITLLLFSCSKEVDYSQYSQVKPDMDISSGAYNLDFVAMHNYVINTISDDYNPFFYIKEGKFDISGDNDKKNISIKCTCVKGTTIEDLDLFLSLVITYISVNASEQDFRFKEPTVDSDGTYLNYGTVFNTFSLDIYADLEDGTVLRNNHINAGDKIPIDSRYWRE